MDRLSDLPLELFQSYILIHLSRNELSILSRTSIGHRAGVVSRHTVAMAARSLAAASDHLLVRTLISRPSLAMFIEKLDFGGVKPRTRRNRPYGSEMYRLAERSMSIWDTESQSSFSASEMDAIKASILSLGPSSKDLWLQELRRGEVDIFIALLLSQLLNLQHLTLGSEFQCDTPFLGEVMSSNMRSTPKQLFPNLKSVTYSNDIIQDTEVAYHFVDRNQVFPLFYVDSLRTLNMALPPLTITWPQDEVPKSHLTSLVLSHSQVSEENLGQLLMATPQLRSLEFHSHFDIDPGGRSGRTRMDYYDCAKLDKSLAHVMGTLERLVLSVRFSSLKSDVALGGFNGMSHKVESLQHFKKLKDCVIPFIMLLGWNYDANIAIVDLLLALLERICFTDDLDALGVCEWTDEGFLQLIESYLARRGPCELQLRCISLEINTSQTSWCEAECTRLKVLCDAAEVDCNREHFLSMDLHTQVAAISVVRFRNLDTNLCAKSSIDI